MHHKDSVSSVNVHEKVVVHNNHATSKNPHVQIKQTDRIETENEHVKVSENGGQSRSNSGNLRVEHSGSVIKEEEHVRINGNGGSAVIQKESVQIEHGDCSNIFLENLRLHQHLHFQADNDINCHGSKTVRNGCKGVVKCLPGGY